MKLLLRRLLAGTATAVAVLMCGVAQATTLPVPQNYQEQDQWCWAGSSKSILDYYGVSKTQTEIAQYGTLGQNIWNYLWGQYTNPTRNGIDLILYYFGSISTGKYSRALTLTESGTEINASRPFVVRWGWDTGGGHFVVARGLDATTMSLMDPWDGPTINSYDWVVRGSSHTWTHTLTMLSAPSLPVLTVTTLGQGTVSSNDGRINCGSTCSANFPLGSTVTLSATPSAGYIFGGWGGGCASVAGTTCVVNMSTSTSVTAAFTSAPAVVPLGNGTPVTGLAGTASGERYFSLDIPTGATNLTIAISGGTGDADLYVRFGSMPTTTTYDCRPYLGGNSETCTFPTPSAGNYFVMIRGYTDYSGVTLQASYTAPMPDLVVSSFSAGTSARPGGPLIVSVVTTNQGSAASGEYKTRFYISDNPTITPNDLDTGYWCGMMALAVGATGTCAGPITIPASLPRGTYYVGAIADADEEVAESQEANNSGAASQPTRIWPPIDITPILMLLLDD